MTCGLTPRWVNDTQGVEAEFKGPRRLPDQAGRGVAGTNPKNPALQLQVRSSQHSGYRWQSILSLCGSR